MDKKYSLVIGGSGFVGSYLIENLNKDSVINYDKKQSPFFNEITTIGNVLDLKKLEKSFNNVDSVILLAAEHKDNVVPKSLYYDVNVNGTKNVLKCMSKFGVKKLIFTSSVAVYGLDKTNPDEYSVTNPFNHYGKSKLLAEEEIINWYNDDPADKSVTIVRPTVIFGVRNRGNVYNLLKQIYNGKFIMIGNGKNKKSLAYVKNFVAFIQQRILNKNPGISIINYVDKPDFTVDQMVNLIYKQLGYKKNTFKIPYLIGLIAGYTFDAISFFLRKDLNISSIRIKKFCSTTQFDSKKLDKIFKPPYSIKKGLVDTIRYEFYESIKK